MQQNLCEIYIYIVFCIYMHYMYSSFYINVNAISEVYLMCGIFYHKTFCSDTVPNEINGVSVYGT